MRSPRRDFYPAARRQLRQFRAQRNDVSARTPDGIANFGAQLNDRLVHLRFDLLFERDFSAFENFVNVRTQFACLRVDNRELLFDSQSERVVLNAHRGLEMFLKNATMSCGAPRRDSRGPSMYVHVLSIFYTASRHLNT